MRPIKLALEKPVLHENYSREIVFVVIEKANSNSDFLKFDLETQVKDIDDASMSSRYGTIAKTFKCLTFNLEINAIDDFTNV